MSNYQDKFIRRPIDEEDNKILIYDSTSDLWLSGNISNHELDSHIDIPTKPTSGNKILEDQDGVLSWIDTSDIFSGKAPSITFAVRDSSKDYIETNLTSWSIMITFCYPGTSGFSPTKFSIVGSRDNNIGTAFCRLYDLTNNQEIGLISWAAKEKAIYSDSDLVNLPSGEAMLEVQIKKSTGSKVRFHSCTII